VKILKLIYSSNSIAILNAVAIITDNKNKKYSESILLTSHPQLRPDFDSLTL